MILDILKLKKKGNIFYFILAILADLETRLESWSYQIRPSLGTLNIGFGGLGFFGMFFNVHKLPPLVIKITPLGPHILLFGGLGMVWHGLKHL